MTKPIESLDEALRFGADGLFKRPLDVIELILPASAAPPEKRESVWRRLYLEAPLPYWGVARWARKLTHERLTGDLAITESQGWGRRDKPPASVEQVLREVAERFDAFDPDLFPWDDGAEDEDPPQRLKYVLGRELARSYVLQQAGGVPDRHGLLLSSLPAWREWVALNATSGFSAEETSIAVVVATDHLVARDVTAGLNGVGRSHVLLEHDNEETSSAAGVVTASLMPLGSRHAHLDGMIVPDLRENGLLLISDDFLGGVAASWRYCRRNAPPAGPAMLCFSVRTSVATVVQRLSGRSAEAAVMAAIESAFRKRVLRPDTAASATLSLDGAEHAALDPEMGPVSFEDRKYVAAAGLGLSKVVVHADDARDWNERSLVASHHRAGPEVVAGKFYRRDVLRFLETRSLWKRAIAVPAAATAIFALLACCWQLYKWSAVTPDAPTVEGIGRLPLVRPGLVAAEMGCLFLCVYVLLYSAGSIRRSLDSGRSSLIAFGFCLMVVLSAQFVPIGVRYEGLLDNPFYSVLFGEPQLTARQVIDAGGVGLLVLHTISQTTGFVTILYGVSAFVLRLLQTRAHTEPIYEDRCELIHKDWRFALSMMGAFLAVVLAFGFVRNTLWYYYLTTLPGVRMIDRQGAFVEVVAPLVGICLVLILSVGVVWLATLHAYLTRVVASAEGRSGYTPEDVVSRLPRLARLLYLVRAID